MESNTPLEPYVPVMGRPSLYSEELVETICDRIAGGEALVNICKDEGMPSRLTVLKWLNKYEEFGNLYAKAREAQADFYLEQIIDIADEEPMIETESTDKKTGEIVVERKYDNAGINRNRLRVDTRKWALAKLAPKKYGEKILTEDDGTLVIVNGRDI